MLQQEWPRSEPKRGHAFQRECALASCPCNQFRLVLSSFIFRVTLSVLIATGVCSGKQQKRDPPTPLYGGLGESSPPYAWVTGGFAGRLRPSCA